MEKHFKLRAIIALGLIFAFLVNSLGPICPIACSAEGEFSLPAHGQEVADLPAPGTMVNLSPAFEPVLIKGLKVHPDNPFLFDFIIDTGDVFRHPERSEGSKGALRSFGLRPQDDKALKEESNKLIKYFLAAMTVPEKDLWVNLSPYEKDRIIAPNLGQTEMGRDMLAQDYILKQLTASLIYPEKHLGKEFWDRVYTKAQQMYGTTQISVNTFNKVWIVADRADVYERGNVAYVVGAHLKVMLEEDYLAKEKHLNNIPSPSEGRVREGGPSQGNNRPTNAIASQIIKQIILPAIEHEVNAGQNFAPLRQMFYSMILASWYKMALKDAILTQIYGNQSKVKGLEYKNSVNISKAITGALGQEKAKTSLATKQSFNDVDAIFQRYLQAYKKGVFNYIKDDVDNSIVISDTKYYVIPRKYFSGGVAVRTDLAMRVVNTIPANASLRIGDIFDASVNTSPKNRNDGAMNVEKDRAMDSISNFKVIEHTTDREVVLASAQEIAGSPIQSDAVKIHVTAAYGASPQSETLVNFLTSTNPHQRDVLHVLGVVQFQKRKMPFNIHNLNTLGDRYPLVALLSIWARYALKLSLKNGVDQEKIVFEFLSDQKKLDSLISEFLRSEKASGGGNREQELRERFGQLYHALQIIQGTLRSHSVLASERNDARGQTEGSLEGKDEAMTMSLQQRIREIANTYQKAVNSPFRSKGTRPDRKIIYHDFLESYRNMLKGIIESIDPKVSNIRIGYAFMGADGIPASIAKTVAVNISDNDIATGLSQVGEVLGNGLLSQTYRNVINLGVVLDATRESSYGFLDTPAKSRWILLLKGFSEYFALEMRERKLPPSASQQALHSILRNILDRLHEGDCVLVLDHLDAHTLAQMGIASAGKELKLLIPTDFEYLGMEGTDHISYSFIMPNSLLLLTKKGGHWVDVAMNTHKKGRNQEFDKKENGGIDLDRSKMQMNVSKDAAMGGVRLNFDPAQIARIKRDGFDGLEFKIESIVPVMNLPGILDGSI